MSCTAYGAEREDPDWTADELELLELELQAARKRILLKEAKAAKTTPDTIEERLTNRYTSQSYKIRVRTELASAEREVYEAAHDRHFFDSLKRRRALTHAHAHQPHRNTNG